MLFLHQSQTSAIRVSHGALKLTESELKEKLEAWFLTTDMAWEIDAFQQSGLVEVETWHIGAGETQTDVVFWGDDGIARFEQIAEAALAEWIEVVEIA